MERDRDEAKGMNDPSAAPGAAPDGAGRQAGDAPDLESGQSPEEAAQEQGVSVQRGQPSP